MLILAKASMALMLGFVLSLITGLIIVPLFKKLHFGQSVSHLINERHLKKEGTPTMGGILFLVGILVGSAFYIPDYKKIIPILFVTLGFGLIGFLDDYIKVVMKRNLGLTPAQKMLGQIVITAVFAFYMVNHSGLGTDVIIPFSGGKEWHLGILYIPILFVVVLGTVNGANFTDGLDGLAASVTTLIAVFLTVIAVGTNAGIHPVICAVIGALLGFLCFNTHPAKVFMGDTGSLALGGFVVSAAYMLKIPLFIPIVAFIYFIEVLSVIIQVTYYKKTKKRIFKMAPIHHHFELSGWPETKVVSIFSIVTAVLCLIGMLAY